MIDVDVKKAVGEVRPEFLESFPILLGREIEISMPNGEKHKAQFMIVDMDDIIASHNEENFFPSEGYPVNEQGNSINDRNYKDDIDSQKAVMDYARNLEAERLITTSRTPSGTPIITKDGFIVSGNNRTMSLKLAKSQHPEKYKEYLKFLQEEIESFGFKQYIGTALIMGERIPVEGSSFYDPKNVKFDNPVLVRMDYDFGEYATRELAKYNKDTKKSERPVDKAIKLSNILRESEQCASIIADVVGNYEIFSDFYGNIIDQKKLAKRLIECDLLTEQELPAYFNGTTYTNAGKEFIENLLAALILDRDALISGEQEGVKGMKRKLITALPVLMKNANLKEGSLKEHINQAIILQYRIKISGLNFVDFVRQYSLFDETYDIKTVYINRLLNTGKLIFKQSIDSYNKSVLANEGESLFGEKPSIDEIFLHHIIDKIEDTEKRIIESSNIIEGKEEKPEKTGTMETIVKEKTFSLVGDEFYKDNPEKILGDPYEASGRFGTATKYKGDVKDLEKIEIPDFFSEEEIMGGVEEVEAEIITDKLAGDAVDNAIEEGKKNIIEAKDKEIKEKEQEAEPYEIPSDAELLSFEQVYKKYNKGISDDQAKAFIWYKHQIGQTLQGKWLSIFNPLTLTQEQEATWINKWVHSQILFYHDGNLIPEFLYLAENVYEREKQLNGDKKKIIEIYGQDVYDKQVEQINKAVKEVQTVRLTLNNPKEEDRLTILPTSDFARSFTISTFEDEKPFEMKITKREVNRGNPDYLYDMSGYIPWGHKKTYEKVSLQGAYMYWLNAYRNEITFKSNTTWFEIIKFYIFKAQYNEKRDGNRANFERIKARAMSEGKRLFAYFLANVIKESDREDIENKWNRKFNGYKKIDYSKVPIGFTVAKNYPGNDPMDVRSEKREAVAFTFAEGSGLLAYQVGLGKTWAAIFTIAQFMECGYCRRPFLVVPNQTYKQWISEIKGILPHIKINDLYNLSKDYIEELEGKDGIDKVEANSISIMTEEGFRRIGFNEDTEGKIMDDLVEILSQQVDPDATDKQSKRQAEAFKEKLEKLLGRGLSQTMVNIEDLGFDFMIVDEAHSMKKVFTSVAGKKVERQGKEVKQREYDISAGTPSTIALKGFMITHYIMSNNGNKNVQMLTATPFTNSPLEVYSMLSLIAYHKLVSMGLNNLTDFFDTYCQISYELVITAQLKPEVKQVFKGFDNLISLQQLLFRFMNYKEAGKGEGSVPLVRPEKWVLPLKQKIVNNKWVKVPEGEKVDTYLPMTAQQSAMMDDIRSYMSDDNMTFEQLKTRGIVQEVEQEINIKDEDETANYDTEGIELEEDYLDDEEKKGVKVLRGINFARSLALSPYLFEYSGLGTPSHRQYIETSPKLKYIIECIRGVKKYHQDKGELLSGQIIYMDRGKKYFELIRDYLVKEIGYKEHEVGIIKSGMSGSEIKKITSRLNVKGVSNQKEYKDFVKNRFLGLEFDYTTKSFKDIPDEERIKIIIGSSSIREGMNLQRYSTVLYNAFLDWNPTDMVQVTGRLWRQGNKYKHVRIVNPLMEDSMDIFMFEKLEQKTSRINAIWNYDGKTNVLPTDEFDPEECKLALIKNPETIALYKIEIIEKQIEDEKGSFYSDIRMAEKAKELFSTIEDNEKELRKIVNKHDPPKEGEERALSTLMSKFEKMFKSQKNAAGIPFKNVADSMQRYDRYEYGLDWQGELSKPNWYKDLKGAMSQIARIKKEFLNPRSISSSEKSLDKFIEKAEKIIIDKTKYMENVRSDESMRNMVAEIMEERRNIDYKPARLEDRIKEFGTLNYLLSEMRSSITTAEEFKRIDADMCPPVDKDGKMLIDKKSIDMLERCIADLPETKDLHLVPGTDEYTEDRLRLHQRIIENNRKGAVCQTYQQPIAILTGGVPGSGKSYFLKKYAPYLKSDKILTIDADEIREKLPEYKGWNSKATHKETRDIYYKMLDDVRSGEPCEYDVLWDGTMNKVKNYIPLVKKLQQLGYKVFCIFVEVPAKISKERVLRRYQHTGRYVPRVVVDEANKAGMDAFRIIREMVSGWMLVDGETAEIKKIEGEKIPDDRDYFKKPFTAKDKKIKIAKAKASAMKMRLRLLEL